MNSSKYFTINVTKHTLLLEAAIIWTFAGGMLLYRGSSMLEASSGFSWEKIVGCICIGLIFFVLVFLKISRKHVHRILTLEGDRHQFYEFFNPRSYLMMLGMISLGIFLRKTSIVPLASLSLAYITMGIPLLLSSFRFYYRWFYYLPVTGNSIS
ncbi:MAG: hypothetical protein GZ094_13370 [Mariniphaga sp.]|nr:hypothetical protein [Mariniphaga sp.]